MSDLGDLILKEVNVVKEFTAKSQAGITITSDQITYPKDLGQVPDDAYEISRTAVYLLASSSAFHAGSSLFFSARGNFREFSQTIENDPSSITPPVLANVYIDLQSSDKSDSTTVEIHFTALETPYGTPVDPRIRFVCEGMFSPASATDCRFRAVLELNMKGEVNCVDSPELTGGAGDKNLSIEDKSPEGFYLGSD